jgi:hypothetical protein
MEQLIIAILRYAVDVTAIWRENPKTSFSATAYYNCSVSLGSR